MHHLFRRTLAALSLTGAVMLCLSAVQAAAIPCTKDNLRATYLQKVASGEDVTHLQRKSWWKPCPLAVRKSVYAGLGSTSSASSVSSSSFSSLAASMASNLPVLGTAAELQGLGQWFNSDPLTLASLKGKVVLVHFWTFECINCIHTLPSVEGYWDKYGKQNFVVLGVHSPEFTFEKSAQHLQEAITKFGLKYPIVQDNDFATWKAYSNQYWPALYLIDAKGTIRYEHFGEGDYDVIDANIQSLLKEGA